MEPLIEYNRHFILVMYKVAGFKSIEITVTDDALTYIKHNEAREIIKLREISSILIGQCTPKLKDSRSAEFHADHGFFSIVNQKGKAYDFSMPPPNREKFILFLIDRLATMTPPRLTKRGLSTVKQAITGLGVDDEFRIDIVDARGVENVDEYHLESIAADIHTDIDEDGEHQDISYRFPATEIRQQDSASMLGAGIMGGASVQRIKSAMYDFIRKSPSIMTAEPNQKRDIGKMRRMSRKIRSMKLEKKQFLKEQKLSKCQVKALKAMLKKKMEVHEREHKEMQMIVYDGKQSELERIMDLQDMREINDKLEKKVYIQGSEIQRLRHENETLQKHLEASQNKYSSCKSELDRTRDFVGDIKRSIGTISAAVKDLPESKLPAHHATFLGDVKQSIVNINSVVKDLPQADTPLQDAS